MSFSGSDHFSKSRFTELKSLWRQPTDMQKKEDNTDLGSFQPPYKKTASGSGLTPSPQPSPYTPHTQSPPSVPNSQNIHHLGSQNSNFRSSSANTSPNNFPRSNSDSTNAEEAKSVEFRKMVRGLDKMFKSMRLATENLPYAPQPEHIKSKLMPHQLQALHWMIEKEHSELKGGILADDMGLGKSIQILSLIGANRSQRPTLIVAPLTTLANWENEIIKHCFEGTFKVHVHHGNNKLPTSKKVEAFDIIITTFATLGKELDKAKQPLLRTKWGRIVLDEAHTIKNHKTNNFKGCYAVGQFTGGIYRWSLTGTIIQNNLDDFFSQLKFLRYSTYADEHGYNEWRSHISSNFNQQTYNLQKLYPIVADIVLRRRKNAMIQGIPVCPLPEKIEEQVLIHFTHAENVFYRKYEEFAYKTVSELERKGGEKELKRNFVFLLELILRLKQACDHYYLTSFGIYVKENHCSPNFTQLQNEVDSIVDAEHFKKKSHPCALCHDAADSPMECGHHMCSMCFYVIERVKTECPICGQDLIKSDKSLDEIIEEDLEAEVGLSQDGLDYEAQAKREKKSRSILESLNGVKIPQSAKIKAIMDSLVARRQEDKTNKVVIYSQYVSFLDLLNAIIRQEHPNWPVWQLDGRKSYQSRKTSIDGFTGEKGWGIMLVSIMSGGVGINLVAANYVFIADFWWNPAVESQAVDRLYRMGQERKVVVCRFVMTDTIEVRILELQNRKAILAKSTMVDETPTQIESARLTMAEIRSLLPQAPTVGTKKSF